MKIGRESGFYRPYAIVVNNRGYYVENICFYNESGVVVSTKGWLENNNGGDIKEIELPIEEIKLRRKENFDGKVFAMTNKNKYTNETRMKLYIPCNMLDIHFVEKRYMMFIPFTREIKKSRLNSSLNPLMWNCKISAANTNSFAATLIHQLYILKRLTMLLLTLKK